MSNINKENHINKPGSLEIHIGALYKTTFRKANTFCDDSHSNIFKYCAFHKGIDECDAPKGARCILHKYTDNSSGIYIKVRYIKIRNLKEKLCVNRNKE